MNTDELLAAGDPHPERSVERLALQAESHALMEEIMTTPTKAPTDHVPRVRRPRWIVPVAAAATVAAMVAGAVAYFDPQPDQDTATVAPAAPKTGVSPPTSDNLRYVTLIAEGWEVTHMSQDELGGVIAWSDGESTLDMTWYPAGDHGHYLNDRESAASKTRRASVLGQTGWEFRVRYNDSDGGQWWTPDSAPKASGNKGQSGKKKLRVTTILPAKGDWFLEFDAEVPNERAYLDLMASLRRVDRRTWLDAMDGSVVRPAEAQSFLDEARRDVRMPPGVTVTPADLRLPQDPSQASAAFATPVMCGWAEEYANGNEAALTVLQNSRDWPVMEAAPGFQSEVDWLAEHPNYEGWRGVWGC